MKIEFVLDFFLKATYVYVYTYHKWKTLEHGIMNEYYTYVD